MNEACHTLSALFPHQKKIVILGTSREKNLAHILKPLLPISAYLIATKSNNPRAQEPKVILETINQMGYNKPTFWASNLKEALQIVSRIHRIQSVAFITGSLFLVGEGRELLKCPKLI